MSEWHERRAWRSGFVWGFVAAAAIEVIEFLLRSP